MGFENVTISIGHFIPNYLIQKSNLKLFLRLFHTISSKFNVKAPTNGRFIDVVSNPTVLHTDDVLKMNLCPSFKAALCTFHHKQPLVARVEST